MPLFQLRTDDNYCRVDNHLLLASPVRNYVSNMPSQPVILVDDNHDDLFILKRLLTRAGLKNPFVSFDSAEEAKMFLDAALRTETNLVPAAIFSDKEMPGLDGLEFLAWVRQHPLLKDVPFILVTSSGTPDDPKRAKKLGVTRFFEKFPPAHVLEELFNGQPPHK
jgi:CheY-like chemotaxis protein